MRGRRYFVRSSRLSPELLLPVLLIPAVGWADSRTQTDWLGGPGVMGPVTGFGSEFYCDTETSWDVAPGNLMCDYSATAQVIGMGSPLDACPGDFDGDGHTDVASVHWWHDRVDYHLNTDGTGTQWDNGTVVESFDYAIALATGDMDEDGLDDVVASAYYDEVLSLFLSPEMPGRPWDRVDIETGIGVNYLDASDINGDGHMDVLATSLDPDEVSWWENDGTGVGWTRHVVAAGFDSPRWARARDIDDDGDLDVLGVSYGYSYVVWWENEDGSGETWTAHFVDSYYQFPSSVDGADVDLDGDMDVVATSYVHGLVTLWENLDGTGNSWEERQIGSAGGAGSATACDIDLDGDIDVSVSGYWLHDLIWLENLDGTGNEWAQHHCADYSDPEMLSVCDINGDGTPDFLSCSNEENSVQWWDHISDRYSDMGRLESSVLQITGCSFPVDWGTLSWNGSEPAGTSLAFLVRGSGDPDSILLYTEWSDTITTSGTDLTGILGPDDEFFQYKALLCSNTLDTPVLEDVTVTWTSLGTEEHGSSGLPSPGLYPASNPSRGSVTVSFIPSAGAGAEITLFDLAGRVLRTRSYGRDVCGSFTFDNLPAGIYCTVMRSGSKCHRRLLTVLP